MQRRNTSGRRSALTALLTVSLLVVAHGGDEDAEAPDDGRIRIARTADGDLDAETVRARLRAAHRQERSGLARALHSARWQTRLAAVRAVAEARGDGVVTTLVQRAVEDSDERVRDAAIEALLGRDAVRPLLARTSGGTAERRQNALRALERLDDPRAVHVLVTRFEAHGGGAPEAHTSVLSQRTFIQDFDVEVA